MAKLETFLNILGHYKYLITITLGLLFLGVLSESSILNLIKLDMQKDDLQSEIETYDKQNKESKKELDALKSDPNAVERVAREQYFMKKPDEDVFVFSTDKSTQPEVDENPDEEVVGDTE